MPSVRPGGESLLDVNITSTPSVCGKFSSLKKMRLDGTLGREQYRQQISAVPSHQNISAPDGILSKLSGVVGGGLAEPSVQGQAAAALFWVENNMGYADDNVAFVKGSFSTYIPNPAMCQSYGRNGGGKQTLS